LAIAEWKNFSRAAEVRCVTQSALSRRIRSLEEWVGVELVDRGTYPVQLTAAGVAFCSESAMPSPASCACAPACAKWSACRDARSR
jgi:DNA-binding transcriptional LysR family regulator